MSQNHGFSLLELMIVLAIIGLIMAVAAPAFNAAMPGLETKSAVRQLNAVLRYARATAMTSGEDSQVILDLEQHVFYLIDEEKRYHLPENLTVDIESVESEKISETISGFRFFSDGSSTGGRISLKREGWHYDIDIDWLSGRIEVLDLMADKIEYAK